jgi:ABC-type polysaccharide/polyol phosphate export permease
MPRFSVKAMILVTAYFAVAFGSLASYRRGHGPLTAAITLPMYFVIAVLWVRYVARPSRKP